MKNYYFTFGSNHTTQDGMSLGNYYVKISAVDMGIARDKMFDARGPKWSMCYTEKEFEGEPEKWRINEIPLHFVVLKEKS